jgi:hypothetical protein
MKLTLNALIAAMFSLLLPGLGHIMIGRFSWAAFWLICGLFTGGLGNLIAAVHIIMLEAN